MKKLSVGSCQLSVGLSAKFSREVLELTSGVYGDSKRGFTRFEDGGSNHCSFRQQ
jgi:hypothetical protein